MLRWTIITVICFEVNEAVVVVVDDDDVFLMLLLSLLLAMITITNVRLVVRDGRRRLPLY